MTLLHLSSVAECLVSIALNLDMLLTLKNSFNRSRNLMLILMFIKVCFCFLFILTCIDISTVLQTISLEDSKHQHITADKGLYQEINRYNHDAKVPLRVFYFLVSYVTSLVIVVELLKIKRKKVGGDQVHKVLKRQLIYSFAVTFFEYPFIVYYVVNTWKQNNYKQNKISKVELD